MKGRKTLRRLTGTLSIALLLGFCLCFVVSAIETPWITLTPDSGSAETTGTEQPGETPTSQPAETTAVPGTEPGTGTAELPPAGDPATEASGDSVTDAPGEPTTGAPAKRGCQSALGGTILPVLLLFACAAGGKRDPNV